MNRPRVQWNLNFNGSIISGGALALTSVPSALLTWVCWMHAKMLPKLSSKIVEKSCKAFPNWLCCLCLPSWAMQYHYDIGPRCLGDGGVVRSPLCLSGSQMNNLYGELEKIGNEKGIVIVWEANYLWAWRAMQQAFQSNSIGMRPIHLFLNSTEFCSVSIQEKFFTSWDQNSEFCMHHEVSHLFINHSLFIDKFCLWIPCYGLPQFKATGKTVGPVSGRAFQLLFEKFPLLFF